MFFYESSSKLVELFILTSKITTKMAKEKKGSRFSGQLFRFFLANNIFLAGACTFFHNLR